MRSFKTKEKHGPEWHIQQNIITFLRAREWFVKSTHGNAYQSGFPDLFCSHRVYGQRWVEVKNLENYKFTAAQLDLFPLFVANGSGIWILVEANESEYQKLFKKCNWYLYLK